MTSEREMRNVQATKIFLSGTRHLT